VKKCQDAEQVEVRLRDQQGMPHLCFELKLSAEAGRQIEVAHAVPVTILTEQEADALREPQIPDAQLQVILPPLQKLRTFRVDLSRAPAKTLAPLCAAVKELKLEAVTVTAQTCIGITDLDAAVEAMERLTPLPDLKEVKFNFKGMSNVPSMRVAPLVKAFTKVKLKDAGAVLLDLSGVRILQSENVGAAKLRQKMDLAHIDAACKAYEEDVSSSRAFFDGLNKGDFWLCPFTTFHGTACGCRRKGRQQIVQHCRVMHADQCREKAPVDERKWVAAVS